MIFMILINNLNYYLLMFLNFFSYNSYNSMSIYNDYKTKYESCTSYIKILEVI